MNAELESLKAACGTVLKNANVSVTSKTGKLLVFAFWTGVLRATPDKPHAYETLCLMSGRYDDLVT